ncbi:hypothetical protein LCGC14_0942000 [marine sediment metagenome]|uniref:Uncharacterized protein n=1 Tax=marine sediment metagenome TaxID=412755 RepID=A0A0F9R3I2_9ZZZZ
MARLFDKNCAVMERTADGQALGRCWFYVGDRNVCPRHGDVQKVQEHFVETGHLTDRRKDDERYVR